MRNLRHHAADGVRIRALDYLVQPGKSQAFDHSLLFYRGTNSGTHPLQVNLSAARIRFLRRHFHEPRCFVEEHVFSRALRAITHWGFRPCGNFYSSCAVLPRMIATLSRLFNCFSASKVALITLCGLVVPIDFVSTFCTPAEVITARTAPPAITPVPSGAGLSRTLPAP